jgi:hypothetical protein
LLFEGLDAFSEDSFLTTGLAAVLAAGFGAAPTISKIIK